MGKDCWTIVNNSTEYREKRYLNDKVGHAYKTGLGWKAFYDGVFLGTCVNVDQAQALADLHSTLRCAT